MAYLHRLYRYTCRVCGTIIEDSRPVVFVRKIELHEKEHKKRPAGVA
ncbi:MAG: hypothetical protein H3Z52_06300 [archaeon]|nr:hypothetical protein [archaeon]MCP8320534.1 hypothetical protein [archaeon]